MNTLDKITNHMIRQAQNPNHITSSDEAICLEIDALRREQQELKRIIHNITTKGTDE